MTHRIVRVLPKENCVLHVVFQNGEEKKYDMHKLYPVFPQFEVFEKIDGLFENVCVDVGGYGISWNDELDLDAEEIWENGIKVNEKTVTDIRMIIGVRLAEARELCGMTQKQLAEKTGIYQADISKIERGIANPSIKTLERLANGLGMKLLVFFDLENKP